MARGRTCIFFLNNNEIAAKRHYCPLEVEKTLNPLPNCPPFLIYPIHKYWCNLTIWRWLYSSIITLKVKCQHGTNRLYWWPKLMVITITKSNKRCAAIVYLYGPTIGTQAHHCCTNRFWTVNCHFSAISLSIKKITCLAQVLRGEPSG